MSSYLFVGWYLPRCLPSLQGTHALVPAATYTCWAADRACNNWSLDQGMRLCEVRPAGWGALQTFERPGLAQAVVGCSVTTTDQRPGISRIDAGVSFLPVPCVQNACSNTVDSCAAVAGLPGHPLAERVCGLLENARPSCRQDCDSARVLQA
jgi:hypothetical protein